MARTIPRHGAKLLIGETALHALLDLPDGVRLAHVRTDTDPVRTSFFLDETGPDTAPWLPLLREDVERDIVGTVQPVDLGSGVIGVRIQWHGAEPPAQLHAGPWSRDDLTAEIERLRLQLRAVAGDGPALALGQVEEELAEDRRVVERLETALSESEDRCDRFKEQESNWIRRAGEWDTERKAWVAEAEVRSRQLADQRAIIAGLRDEVAEQLRLRQQAIGVRDGLVGQQRALINERDYLSGRCGELAAQVDALRRELDAHDVDAAPVSFLSDQEAHGRDVSYARAVTAAQDPRRDPYPWTAPEVGSLVSAWTAPEVGSVVSSETTFFPPGTDASAAAAADPIRAAQVAAVQAIDDLADTVRRERG